MQLDAITFAPNGKSRRRLWTENLPLGIHRTIQYVTKQVAVWFTNCCITSAHAPNPATAKPIQTAAASKADTKLEMVSTLKRKSLVT